MARKRMIDPCIWESEDFSSLSVFARLVWIGLFSNADDEGRGKANASYIKSQIFPYDEEMPPKKIQSALDEIANTMSISFYEVDKKKYYQLLNWSKFQTINRPSPSQIPSQKQTEMKSQETVSDNSLNNHGEFNEYSVSPPASINEPSLPNKKEEDNKLVHNIFNKYSIAGACARVEEKTPEERLFFERFYKDYFDWCYSGRMKDVAYEIIDTMIEARNQAKSEDGLKFKSKVYDVSTFSSVLFKIDCGRFRSIVKQLAFNEEIEHRPLYILGCLVAAAESNDKISQEELDRYIKEMEYHDEDG